MCSVCGPLRKDTNWATYRQGLSSTQRGYGQRWRRLRAAILAREPLCRTCGRPADEVDHIVPLAQGGAAYDEANLQPICIECHGSKTAAESTGGGAGQFFLTDGPGTDRKSVV